MSKKETVATLGKNLTYQRKLKGLSQDALAKKSNVTIRTIQRIEKEEVNPQLQTLVLLADALGIDLQQLTLFENPRDEEIQNKWLFLLHISPLLGFIFPFSVLFPLLVWLHKRDDHTKYYQYGIKVINFQLNMTFIYILAAIALVTVEKWGFLFFIAVVPFNIIIITYNIFASALTRKVFYPVLLPIIGGRKHHKFKMILTLVLLVVVPKFVFASHQTSVSYDELLDYEGNYEYLNKGTLDIAASALDTTLYAIIDDAKYPLRYVGIDSFVNLQNTPVVFFRDPSSLVAGYRVEGQSFQLLAEHIDKQVMFPRKELYHDPDSYSYDSPMNTNDGLEVGNLREVFENSEPILEMVRQTIKGNFPEVHSILILKNNKLVLEEYFYGYDRDTPHQLRSATKSMIGGIVGIAIDQGWIKSERTPIYPYFAAVYPEFHELNPEKKQITVEDFLTYRHGLDCSNNDPSSQGNEIRMMESTDWVKHTLDLPVIETPGRVAAYCSGCALTIGRLVEIVTARNIELFAASFLFEPMGITNYDWNFEPNQSSMTHFSQMYLTPRDMMKIATLFKNDGLWKGKQLISKRWIDKMFNGGGKAFGYFWKHKYFVINGKKYHSYMATGNGGQKINIWPELDMITVFTGGNYNSYQLYGKSTPPNDMIPRFILPSFEPVGKLTE